VVGAGPAGLSAAHRLSMLGHRVTVFEAKPKAGGLNEFGLAAYKMVDDFAAKEIQFILQLGGIEIRHNQLLGRNFTLESLRKEYDAIFLGMGLPESKSLGIPGENFPGVWKATEYIENIRQAQATQSLSKLPVGKQVVVIGGGNTAIDIAVQIKRLGAEFVTIVYRRGREYMSATEKEQEFALTNGVSIRTWLKPVRLLGDDEGVVGVEFVPIPSQNLSSKRHDPSFQEHSLILPADQVFEAIGQSLGEISLRQTHGKIAVDQNFRTSTSKIFAGGDCIDHPNAKDLTVTAVQEGKLAAESIHKELIQKGEHHV
jgi:dihydropyrimidine dehydrogenase (NAD+) subunit PreT